MESINKEKFVNIFRDVKRRHWNENWKGWCSLEDDLANSLGFKSDNDLYFQSRLSDLKKEVEELKKKNGELLKNQSNLLKQHREDTEKIGPLLIGNAKLKIKKGKSKIIIEIIPKEHHTKNAHSLHLYKQKVEDSFENPRHPEHFYDETGDDNIESIIFLSSYKKEQQ